MRVCAYAPCTEPVTSDYPLAKYCCAKHRRRESERRLELERGPRVWPPKVDSPGRDLSVPIYGEGRICECGTRISTYQPGDQCWRCANPEYAEYLDQIVEPAVAA